MVRRRDYTKSDSQVLWLILVIDEACEYITLISWLRKYKKSVIYILQQEISNVIHYKKLYQNYLKFLQLNITDNSKIKNEDEK